MRAITELIGLSIVVQATNTQLGLIQTVFVKRDLRSIVAFGLRKPGLFSRGEWFVDADDVAAIGVGSILVRSAESVQKRAASPDWIRHRALGGRPIHDQSGQPLGTLQTLHVDKKGRVTRLQFRRSTPNSPLKTFGYVVRDAVMTVGSATQPLTVDVEMAIDLQRPKRLRQRVQQRVAF